MVVITYDEVKNRFANKGFTLISKNYVSKSTKMDVKCSNISYRHLNDVPDILEDYMCKLPGDPHKIHFTDDDLYTHLTSQDHLKS
jgi:hypothetical protein